MEKERFHQTALGQKLAEICHHIAEVGRKANLEGKTKNIQYFRNEEEKAAFTGLFKMYSMDVLRYVEEYLEAFGHEEGLARLPEHYRKWYQELLKLSEEYKAKGEI